jgi:acetyl-CoA carboxylase carboxyltransferase component
MRRVIGAVVDDDQLLEVQPGYGRSVLCVLARLGGHPVAVIASQPMVQAGAITADAADKAAHFIAVADAFHLPLLFLSDNPGMLAGTASERAGVLRSGARMFAAQTQATSPKLHLTLRKSYGFGSVAMSMLGFDRQSATFAYPGATLGAMSADAMSRASGADSAAADALREAEADASYRSAASLGFDEIIDPAETRDALLDALGRALSRRQQHAEPVQRTAIAP